MHKVDLGPRRQYYAVAVTSQRVRLPSAMHVFAISSIVLYCIFKMSLLAILSDHFSGSASAICAAPCVCLSVCLSVCVRVCVWVGSSSSSSRTY